LGEEENEVGAEDVQRLIEEAKQKRDEIRKADLTWLADPHKKGEIPHPSLTAVSPRFTFLSKGKFEFMGRSVLKRLTDCVNDANASDGNKVVINVMGTKFYGKSHLIAAFVLQQMQAYFNGSANARPILFLPKCGDLAEYQAVYLKRAMLLAFSADEKQLAEIATLPAETNALLTWLSNRVFDVAADQGNDIHEKNWLSDNQQQAAKGILRSLKQMVSDHKCCIVTGYSANNEIMTVKFYKERTEVDLLFYGGLEGEVW